MPQISTGDGGGIGSLFSSPIFLIVILVAMVLLMIIPQRRRDKKVKDMLSAVKVGDRIKTIGGFYGTVVNLKDDIVTIAVGPDKVKLTVVRGAIASVEDSEVEATIDDADVS